MDETKNHRQIRDFMQFDKMSNDFLLTLQYVISQEVKYRGLTPIPVKAISADTDIKDNGTEKP